MALDIKKFMRGFKLFNNATQADSVQLTVGDSYSGNYEFTFPNTGATTGQQVVTTGATQTLSNKTITLTAVTPNRVLHSDGAGTIVATEATYSDSATDVTLNVTTARDFVINGKAVRVPVAAADPAGVQGDIYFNSVGQDLRFFNSGGWQALAASASANQTLSNLLSPTSVNQDLIPSDTSKDLGTTLLPWDNAHIATIDSTTVGATTVNTTTANVSSTLASTNDLTVRAISLKYDIDQASDPAGSAQQQYYNSGDNTFRYHNGTTWQTFANLTDIPNLAANKTLSNLTSPTAINQALNPNAHNTITQGTSSNAFGKIWTTELGISNTGVSNFNTGSVMFGSGTLPAAAPDTASMSVVNNSSGANGGMYIYTSNSGSGVTTKGINLLTGDTTNQSSGNIRLTTGRASAATFQSGNINIATGDGSISTLANTGSINFTTGSTTVQSGNMNFTTGSSTSSVGAFGFISGTASGTGNRGDFIVNLGNDRLLGGAVSLTGRFVAIPTYSLDPANPIAGAMYFNTSTLQLRAYTGSAWKGVTLT